MATSQMTFPEFMEHENQLISWNRRKFLAGAALAGLAGGCVAAGGTPRRIIDSHVHFYDPTRPQGVPWPPKADAVLYRPVLPDEFRQLSAPLGVAGAVLVEASPWVDDNQWTLDLADRHAWILGVVGHLPVGDPQFPDLLRRFLRRPRFKGLRVGAETVRAAVAGGVERRHLAAVAEAGLAVDVLIGPDDLPQVARLAEQLGNLRVVVDHCANIRVGSPPFARAWVSGLAACHYTPHVHFKISGLVENAPLTGGRAPTGAAAYEPVLYNLLRVMGPHRLLFASNWPVSLLFAGYADTLAIPVEFFRARREMMAGVFHENARRVYRL